MEKPDRTKNTRIGSRKLILYYWMPLLSWMAVIYLLSGRHSVSVSPEYVLNFIFFKTLHLIEYAILFLLSARAIHASSAVNPIATYRTAFFVTILYAITDELHQMFVPSREGTLRDVIIDAAGAGFTWYYLSNILRKAPKSLRSLARDLGVSF